MSKWFRASVPHTKRQPYIKERSAYLSKSGYLKEPVSKVEIITKEIKETKRVLFLIAIRNDPRQRQNFGADANGKRLFTSQS